MRPINPCDEQLAHFLSELNLDTKSNQLSWELAGIVIGEALLRYNGRAAIGLCEETKRWSALIVSDGLLLDATAYEWFSILQLIKAPKDSSVVGAIVSDARTLLVHHDGRVEPLLQLVHA